MFRIGFPRVLGNLLFIRAAFHIQRHHLDSTLMYECSHCHHRTATRPQMTTHCKTRKRHPPDSNPSLRIARPDLKEVVVRRMLAAFPLVKTKFFGKSGQSRMLHFLRNL